MHAPLGLIGLPLEIFVHIKVSEETSHQVSLIQTDSFIIDSTEMSACQTLVYCDDLALVKWLCRSFNGAQEHALLF